MPYKSPEDKRRWRKQYNAVNAERLREYKARWEARQRAEKPPPIVSRTQKISICPKGWKKGRARKRKIDEQKALIRTEKSRPCTDCRRSYPHYVMQFDHLPEFGKSFTISKIRGGRAIERLRDEIAKCEVVCANCHAERTYQRQREAADEGIAQRSATLGPLFENLQSRAYAGERSDESQ